MYNVPLLQLTRCLLRCLGASLRLPRSLRAKAKGLHDSVLEEGRDFAPVWDSGDVQVSERREDAKAEREHSRPCTGSQPKSHTGALHNLPSSMYFVCKLQRDQAYPCVRMYICYAKAE